jgi:hypothetical protein
MSAETRDGEAGAVIARIPAILTADKGWPDAGASRNRRSVTPEMDRFLVSQRHERGVAKWWLGALVEGGGVADDQVER